MADAAISATIEVVLGTVISLASERIGLVCGFEKELESLSRYAKSIKCFLADADGKMHSPGVKDWLLLLQEEVLQVESVLEELNYENLRREVEYRNQLKLTKACFSFSFCNAIGFRCRLGSKIRDINSNFDRIIGKANDLGLIMRFQIESALSAPAGAATSRQTDSVPVLKVVGRANDESKIVDMLLSLSDRPLSLLPIIGMGGLGKTTLAKSVYNNPQIVEHFEERIWICVAKKIEIMDLFKFILQSLTKNKVELDQRDAIIQQFREILGKKRYFLVLDDVWNYEQGLWEDFLGTLEGLNSTNGSWCLVTTRLEPMADVSRHLRMKFPPYSLDKLSSEDCWSILKEKLNAGEQMPKELDAIKDQILKRCDGLPLAASLIGGLLLQKGKGEWQSIVEGSLLDRDQNVTKQILKVSFDHLSPAPVKKCFTYCSIFPQDTKLNKDLLIELWMAEGFLQPEQKIEITMEEIGDKYFKTLLQSSLVEEVREQWGLTYYKMHDLVHDFAKTFLNPENSQKECYRTLNSFKGMTENTLEVIPPSIRTLFLECGISGVILSRFKNLHVLKLSGADVKLLPASIGMLIHLRFLDISISSIKILPKSFYKLYNLQTLSVDVRNLKGLPKLMSNLISLRHVHSYEYFPEKFPMPFEIGRLTSLITLDFFNVTRKKGHRIEELGTLRNLKGCLKIRDLQLVNGKEEAKLAYLCEKPYLSSLEFWWDIEDGEVNTSRGDDDVLEGLQPNPNLQRLEIIDFMGYQFPNWFMNMSGLKDLVLHDCKRCRELPALGQLPSLQVLYCRGFDDIRSIGLSFYGIISDNEEGRIGSRSTTNGRFFPALKFLSLQFMGNLEQWKDADEVKSATGGAEVDFFPVLETLEIEDCRQLIIAPSNFPSIQELNIRGGCRVSLVEKILSNLLTVLSLELSDGHVTGVEEAQHISSLHLVKPFGSNLEAHGYGLRLKGCDRLPCEMLKVWGTSLETLIIWNCHNIGELPEDLYEFQALRDLRIGNCSMIDLVTPKKVRRCLLTSLENLLLVNCQQLTNLPIEMLDSCKSLRRLQVCECPNLMSFPLGSLTSLEYLTLDSSSEFDWPGLLSLTTLRGLHLYGLPQILSLPYQLQFLTTLTELVLGNFGIEALPNWIGNLASLASLEIQSCKKLQHLPSMAVMTRLAKLRRLVIVYCPMLEERCKPECGMDFEWSKISHISELQIGQRFISSHPVSFSCS